jgi:hypothetical protein
VLADTAYSDAATSVVIRMHLLSGLHCVLSISRVYRVKSGYERNRCTNFALQPAAPSITSPSDVLNGEETRCGCRNWQRAKDRSARARPPRAESRLIGASSVALDCELLDNNGEVD